MTSLCYLSLLEKWFGVMVVGLSSGDVGSGEGTHPLANSLKAFQERDCCFFHIVYFG